MKKTASNQQLYVKRLINKYPDDKRILEKISLSINGLSNVLILYRGSYPIGFLVLDFFTNQTNSNCACIYQIYVSQSKKCSKDTIKNMLIKEAIKISQEEGFKYISYQVNLSDVEYVKNQLYKDYSYFINKGFNLQAYIDNLYFVKKIDNNSVPNIA